MKGTRPGKGAILPDDDPRVELAWQHIQNTIITIERRHGIAVRVSADFYEGKGGDIFRLPEKARARSTA